MPRPGDIISYIEMSMEEGMNLQRGMNFRLRGKTTIILMSVRQGAPYADRIEENGRILIYEGHDIPNRKDGPNPKVVDQEMFTPNGTLTENGKFFEAAQNYKKKIYPAERVKVYEKLRAGIWVYNGIFKLVDAWLEDSNARKVFKFRLELVNELLPQEEHENELEHGRIIPSEVKLAVWKRDKGKCVMCGSSENLHFDHIIPYSKGGSSLVAENIQLLCAKHNLAKHDKIE
jgi:hypothetical protein